MTSHDEERNRAEDFLNAFNTIEAELKQLTRNDEGVGFRKVVRDYHQQHRWWHRDYEALMAFADLRNIIVHERFERFRFLSIPSVEVVTEIRAIEKRLMRPRTAHSEFGGKVTTVERGAALREVLELIRTTDFTQFPVYHQGQFDGLVTSNGITRWLAERSANLSLIDIDDHTVGNLLAREEKRSNWTFVARNAHVDDVAYAFQNNPRLEAALVTENGEPHETLLGIATQSDIASLVRD